MEGYVQAFVDLFYLTHTTQVSSEPRPNHAAHTKIHALRTAREGYET